MAAPKILVLDVGGTHVKAQLAQQRPLPKIASGSEMTPAHMVEQVTKLLGTADFQSISIGYPGVVVHGKIVAEPENLGPGWVGFDFETAFGRPVKIVNDAAMQALGSYQGGKMLFLGLGTGLGSAMIVEGELVPMELAHLPYKKSRTYEDYVGERGRRRRGKHRWRKHVWSVVDLLRAALEPDYVVIGGGNAARLNHLPAEVRLGDNANAFLGGLRLWQDLSELRGLFGDHRQKPADATPPGREHAKQTRKLAGARRAA